MVDPKKPYALKYAFKSLSSQEVVTHVQMRTILRMGDLRVARKAAPGNAEEQTFFLVQRLSGLSDVEVEQLEVQDFQNLADMINWGSDDPGKE